MFIGYARVSTIEQETRLQLDALRGAGVVKVYSEKASSVGPRPELRRALAALQPGDVLVVWKMDRIARNLRDLLSLLAKVERRGARFRSLTEPIDTSNPLGEFMVQILGAVAQLERSLIRERVLAGQVAAYMRGVRWGGKAPKLGQDDIRELRRLREGGWKIAELCEHFGVSKSTVHGYLSGRSRATPRERLRVLGPLVAAAGGAE